MIDENSTFGGFLTTVGEAKQANANALKTPWKLTHLLLGDANGSDPVPDADQTQLVNQVHRAAINQLSIDPDNPGILIAEVVLPPNIGGWWIRELGIEDEDGDFVAVANCPPSYKPLLAQGSGRNQVVRMHLILSNTANVELKVDPAVVLATREYVDTQRSHHEDDDEAHTDDQIILSVPIAQAPNATKVSEALAALGDFAADGFQNIDVISEVGTVSWPVPDVLKKGLRKALVTTKGAGGGGGNHRTTGGGGGSGGGVAHKLVDLTGVETVEITIGQGGTGAPASTANTDGENGGTSSFGSYCSATGGRGAHNWCPGDGGEGVGGDINTSLGPGTPGAYIRNQSGLKGSPGSGGGPGARSQGAGADGVKGADATLPGGGGAGGTTQGGGGNGFRGEVIVRW
ncbi:phage tail protein [Halomonas sp. 18H]|nr:phage tail protein [Halomonas sp. 18H]MCW4148534.1 phage tail protein [Halomonas sp. 18H]